MMIRKQKYIILFFIVIGVTLGSGAIYLLGHMETTPQNKNSKNELRTVAPTDKIALTAIYNVNKSMKLAHVDLMKNNIKDFIKKYQYQHAGEKDVVLNLSELLFNNNYIAEAKQLLESFINTSIASNENIEIEYLELFRSIYEREGSVIKYKDFLISLPTEYEMKPLLLREGAYFFASNNDYESSTAILSAGVEEFPADLTLRFATAEQYREQGDIQSAIDEYSATFTIEESPIAYFETGKLYYALGNYDSATIAFNNAVRIEPAYDNEIRSEFVGVGMPTL